MSLRFLIDGYNLLHNAGLGRSKFGPGEFEKARNQLLRRLRDSLTEEERNQTSIVFDAQYADHPDRRPFIFAGMTVIFSPRGRQADDLIEILLSSESSPREVMVISSDHRLQRAARSARAGYMSSDGFLVEMDERALQKKREDSEVDPSIFETGSNKNPQEELDAERWMQEFGEIDVDAISDEIIRESSARSEPVQPSEQEKPVETKQNTAPPTGQSHLPRMDRQRSLAPEPAPEGGINPVLPEDVKFWEQRIDELLAGDDNDHLKPPGRRRKR